MWTNALIVSHDPRWAEMFRAESQSVAKALSLAEIYHIGSTAIPDIWAKPIIDMLGEAEDLVNIDAQTHALEAMGYEALGEFGIAGRRYFRKEVNGIRRFHLHVFEKGSDEAKRHIRFRDFMNTHPKWARSYSDLKRRLVSECAGDSDEYIDGKDDFIKEIDRQSEIWERDLKTVCSWFNGEVFAEVIIPQSTYLEFGLSTAGGNQRSARIHYNEYPARIARSKIKGSFKSLTISKDHCLSEFYGFNKGGVGFHKGPVDGSTLLKELRELCDQIYFGMTDISTFVNPYFLDNANFNRSTTGELFYDAPAEFVRQCIPLLEKHDMRFNARFNDPVIKKPTTLLLDSMFVVAAGFRAEILTA